MSYRDKYTQPVVVKRRRLDNFDFIKQLTSRYWGLDPRSDDTIIPLLRTRHAISNWDRQPMARKTYRIELKIDFNDDASHQILLGIAKQYTRDFLASAMLLQDGRKPAAALMTDDSFHGVEEIDILEPSEQLHAPAVSVAP